MHEGPEEGMKHREIPEHHLGMELHPKDESVLLAFDGFHDAVGGTGRRLKTGRGIQDGLMVIAVDPQAHVAQYFF